MKYFLRLIFVTLVLMLFAADDMQDKIINEAMRLVRGGREWAHQIDLQLILRHGQVLALG